MMLRALAKGAAFPMKWQASSPQRANVQFQAKHRGTKQKGVPLSPLLHVFFLSFPSGSKRRWKSAWSWSYRVRRTSDSFSLLIWSHPPPVSSLLLPHWGCASCFPVGFGQWWTCTGDRSQVTRKVLWGISAPQHHCVLAVSLCGVLSIAGCNRILTCGSSE